MRLGFVEIGKAENKLVLKLPGSPERGSRPLHTLLQDSEMR